MKPWISKKIMPISWKISLRVVGLSIIYIMNLDEDPNERGVKEQVTRKKAL